MASPLWCITIGAYEQRRLNRKKLLIFAVSSLVATAVISGMLYGFGALSVYDKEVWHFKALKIRHEEKWTTHETRTETYTTGSGKNKQEHTRTIHYTETHGPYWTTIDENGTSIRVDEGTYAKWKKIWANEQRIGEHEGSSAGWDRATTGGIFECYWTKDFDRIYPVSEIHRYKNKVRYSQSVLKYKEPTKELEKQYPRPADNDNVSPIIAYGGKSFSEAEADLLRRVSAVLGPKCRIHPILMVFGPETSRGVIDDVLSAWGGPNKNELVTFISLDGDVVKWCDVQSWMDDTTIHGTIRDAMMADKFSVKRYADLLLKYVPLQWKKKDFRDFEYLQIEIPMSWKIGALLLSLLAIGVAFVVVDRNVVGFGCGSGFMSSDFKRWNRLQRKMR